MIELEKLLNRLYRGVPVSRAGLISLCAFSFVNSVEAKKNIFELLDDVSCNSGNIIINYISIYELDNVFRLKLLINTIIE